MRANTACAALGVMVMASTSGCQRATEPSPVAAPSSSVSGSSPTTPAPDAGKSAQRSIGVAQMQPDGTLVLDLFGPGGAEARVIYPPSHAQYKDVIAHLGGIKPGEQKSVPPWPDPWDEAKVTAAVHAHAAKKGWKKDEYTVEITGTDADGNAVVTLHHVDDRKLQRPGGGKGVQLRIETRGYTVVRELAFQ